MSDDNGGSGKRNEYSDRLKSRLDRDDGAADAPDTEQRTQRAELDNPDNLDKPAKTENPTKTDEPAVVNPKADWPARPVRIPDGTKGTPDLLDTFDGEFERFRYQCDWDVRKQLHYYPALVHLAVERVEEMPAEDFTALVEGLGLKD